jgi:hypothetical protein
MKTKRNYAVFRREKGPCSYHEDKKELYLGEKKEALYSYYEDKKNYI